MELLLDTGTLNLVEPGTAIANERGDTGVFGPRLELGDLDSPAADAFVLGSTEAPDSFYAF